MKHLSTKIFIFVLFIVAVLSGYNYFQRPFLGRFSMTEEVVEDQPEFTEEDPLQLAFAELTDEEKIQQLVSVPLVLEAGDASLSAELEWIEQHHPGFITIFGNTLSVEKVSDFTQQLASLSMTYRPLVAVDHEGGSVQRLGGQGFTRLLSWQESCQLASSARKEVFYQSAEELNRAGVQLVFAPVVDVGQQNSFLGNRACDDEQLIVAAATDYITSFAQYGVLSVIKHFPGIGSLQSDPHFQLDAVELAAQDTRVFDQLLDTFPNIGVMTTHVVVPDRTAGVPCSLSVVCLDRFPLHFPDALLFTDALEMRAARSELGSEEEKDLAAIAVQAVAAGSDVLVFGEAVQIAELEVVLTALQERYSSDSSFRQQVDQSVMKILRLKISQETQGNNE